MKKYEEFGACLQRILTKKQMSASEAARLVGFRSRNSMFRILAGDTSWEVDARFLMSLREAVGARWQDSDWRELEDALSVKRLGAERFTNDQAFRHALYQSEEIREYIVETTWPDGQKREIPATELLQTLCSGAVEVNVVMCGCCERDLMTMLAGVLSPAGEQGCVSVRHYIDIQDEVAIPAILGVLPMISKVWYNARLVQEGQCPEEMTALYRMHAINLLCVMEDGRRCYHQLLRCDRDRFVHMCLEQEGSVLVSVLDRCRFQLEALKPMARLDGGPAAFVDYTAQYAHLEKDCMILSIKPDLHFNLVPSDMLYQSIMEGFEQAGIASGPELHKLLKQLRTIHDARNRSIRTKRRPTHLIYSLPAMEQFMRTGVQTDHFFIQRAYTPEERRELMRSLYKQMENDMYFHVHFLRPELPEIRNEMTLYEGKGVLMMDAYTGYDLHDDHSEALITLPIFMKGFRQFFIEELLEGQVMSRSETLAALERLIRMV